MNRFAVEYSYTEIFAMSDARKVAPEKWKTIIRHPICKKERVGENEQGMT